MLVNEIFDSLQGEGVLMGKPMTFVRLSGCNLKCKWCDTKYAWNEYKEMTEEQIVAQVKHKYCCITGGEPLLQNLDNLISLLKKSLKRVTVETNGTLRPSNKTLILTDLWTISPKLSNSGELDKCDKELIKDLIHYKSQLKFVIEKFPDDIYEALEFCESVMTHWTLRSYPPVVLQPQGLLFVKARFPDEAELTSYMKHMRKMWMFVASIDTDLDVRCLPQLHRCLYGSQRGR